MEDVCRSPGSQDDIKHKPKDVLPAGASASPHLLGPQALELSQTLLVAWIPIVETSDTHDYVSKSDDRPKHDAEGEFRTTSST